MAECTDESRSEAPRGPRLVNGWFVADEKLPADPMARLVYHARLSPSSHNSQPWRFVTGRAGAETRPARRRPLASMLISA